MSRNQRIALLGLAVVVLVVGFVVAKSGSDDDNNGSATVSQTTTASGGSSGGSSGTTTTTSAAPVIPTVVVKDAKPVGGIKILKYDKGGTIRFKVKSDTADEVHFHGYDVHKDVAKGGTVTFNVPAKIDGKFVVELEDHGEQIASVEVAP